MAKKQRPKKQRPTDLITRRAPRWAWDTIDETLEMDKHSSMIDQNLRNEIENADDAIEAIPEMPALGVYYREREDGPWLLSAILFDNDAGNSLEAMLRHSADYKFQAGDRSDLPESFEADE